MKWCPFQHISTQGEEPFFHKKKKNQIGSHVFGDHVGRVDIPTGKDQVELKETNALESSELKLIGFESIATAFESIATANCHDIEIRNTPVGGFKMLYGLASRIFQHWGCNHQEFRLQQCWATSSIAEAALILDVNVASDDSPSCFARF